MGIDTDEEDSPVTRHPLSPDQQDAVAKITDWFDGLDSGRKINTHMSPPKNPIIGKSPKGHLFGELEERIGFRWKRITGRNHPFFQAGYAGTGKTTLISHVPDTLGLKKKEIMVVAPTNKAVSVLQRKLDDAGMNVRVRTVHQLLYTPSVTETPVFDKTTGERALHPITKEPLVSKKLTFSKRETEHKELRDIRLIIVDEISMVDDRACHDVLDLGIPTLFMGDTGQLPPVGNAQHPSKPYAPFNRNVPNHTLTHIHRQANGSPIADLAQLVREGRTPPIAGYNGVAVIRNHDFQRRVEDAAYALRTFDKIICWKNDDRHQINRIVRHLRGYTGDIPRVGEKIMCMRSNQDLNVGMSPLFSGLTCDVLEVVAYDAYSITMLVALEDDPSEVGQLEFARQTFGRTVPRDMMGDDLAHFDYAYAITCHKAQGSEWDKVIVFDAKLPGGDTHKWRYTAVTRAKNELIYIV